MSQETYNGMEKDARDIARAGKTAIQVGKKSVRGVKSIQAAAAKAASGNTIGAAAEMLKSEDARRIIAVVLLLAFLLTTTIFFAAPLALYETIMKATESIRTWWENTKEKFDQTYYDGTSGRFVSALKALIGLAKNDDIDNSLNDTSAGDEDQATSDDLALIADKAQLKKTYERKLNACKKKMDARIGAIRNTISNSGVIEGVFQSRFNSEYAHLYDDDETIDIVYDGCAVSIMTQKISDQQAINMLALYSTQINSSMDNIKLSGLLKWLGYNNGNKHKLTFPLGDNPSQTFVISAWDGTFMPQYLIDEAVARDSLEEYQKKYGCSVVDLMVRVDCPNLYSIQPTLTDVPITKTKTVYRNVSYWLQIYEEDDAPRYNAYGACIKAGNPEKYEKYWLGYPTNRLVWVRKASAPPCNWHLMKVEYQMPDTVEYEATEVHVKFAACVSISPRSVKSLSKMVGLWEGWLPSEPPYQYQEQKEGSA